MTGFDCKDLARKEKLELLKIIIDNCKDNKFIKKEFKIGLSKNVFGKNSALVKKY